MQVTQELDNSKKKKVSTTPTATVRKSNTTNLNNVARNSTIPSSAKKTEVKVGATAYNSNTSNLNNVARNVTDVTTQNANKKSVSSSDNDEKTSFNTKKTEVSINTEKPKTYSDYYNQMIAKESKQQVEGWTKRREEKIAEGTKKYENQLNEKKAVLEEHKKSAPNYEYNLYQMSDNNGNVISGSDYKKESDAIKSDYEALIAKYEQDNDNYSFVNGYNAIKERADKISAYTNASYNENLSKQYEDNKNEINTIKSQLQSATWEEKQALSEQIKALEAQNEEIKPLVDDINTLKETGYYENLKANGTKEELADFNEYVSHYADNVIERGISIGTSSIMNIANTAVNVGALVKDVALESMGARTQEIAERFKNTGAISNEEYNEMLDIAKTMQNYEAVDSETRNKINEANATIASYIAAGVENPVEKFVLEGVSSTSNFLTQYALLGPVGSLTTMTAQSGTERYFELKSAVDENDNPLYTEKQCLLNGVLTGLLSYATEKIGMDNFANVITGGVGKYISGHALNYIAKSVGTQALSEGLEEVVEGLGDPIIDSITLGTPLEYNPGEIFYAFALGAFSGGLTGTSGALNFVVNTNEQYKSLKGDISALEGLRNKTTSQEELANINRAIAIGMDALNAFTDASVFKGAVEINTQESVQPNAEQTFAEAITPTVAQQLEVSQQVENSVNNIHNISQTVLNQNGVNMDVDQYENLSVESRENVNKVAEFANNLGVDVSFDSTLNNSINGFNIDGQIVLNPNSKTLQSAILGHEITHNLETSKKYSKLVELIKSTTDYQGIYNDVASQYKSVTENIESEAIAKFIEQKIADDSFIESVIKYDSSFANRVFNNIKSMFDSNEKIRIENAWMRAFENAKKNNALNLGLQYSLADKEEQLNIIQNAKVRKTKTPYQKFVNIENVDDIMTFEEAMNNSPKYTDDFSLKGAERALESGKIIIYSPVPIKQGAMVTTSFQELQKYIVYKARYYSEVVNLNEVAWVNTLKGIYANTQYDAKNNKIFNFSNEAKNRIEQFKKELQTLEVDIKDDSKAFDEELNEVYKEIKDNGKLSKENYEALVEMLKQRARIKNSIVFEGLDDIGYTAKDVRSYLKKNPINWQEVKREVPDKKEWKANNFGTFNFKDNGDTYDVLMMEMRDLFPGLIDYESIKSGYEFVNAVQDALSRIEENANGVSDYYIGERGDFTKDSTFVETKIEEFINNLIEFANNGEVEPVENTVQAKETIKELKNTLQKIVGIDLNSSEITKLFKEAYLEYYNNGSINGKTYENLYNLIYENLSNKYKAIDVSEGELNEWFKTLFDKNLSWFANKAIKNSGVAEIIDNDENERIAEQQAQESSDYWQNNVPDDILFANQNGENTSNSDFYKGKTEYKKYTKTEKAKIDEEYNKSIEENGAFEPGMEPRVDFDVPQANKKGKVSQTARTIAETPGVLNNENTTEFKEKINNGDFNYTQNTNDALVKEAFAKLDRVGVDELYKELLSTKKWNARNVVEASILSRELTKNNDARSWDILEAISVQESNAGQMLQALTILKKINPYVALEGVERELSKIQKQVNEKMGDKTVEIKVNEELKEQLLSAEDKVEIERIRQEILQDIKNQVPKTIFEKVIVKTRAWRYLSMLLNPTTHIRNILGNFTSLGMANLKDAVGAVYEGLTSTNPNTDVTRTKAIVSPFSKTYKQAYALGIETYDKVKAEIEAKTKYEGSKDVFGWKPLDKLNKFNSTMLDNEDFWFSRKRFAQSYAKYLIANKVDLTNVSDSGLATKATQYALLEAQKTTFRDFSACAEWLQQAVDSNTPWGYAIDASLPFKKTPINVLKREVEYSPIGLAKVFSKGAYDVASGKITATQYLANSIDDLAAGTVGTAIVGLGAFLAHCGILRAKDDDEDRKQKFDEDNGEQDYSLNLEIFGIDGTYTIDWATPIIAPLAIGAELLNAFKKIDGVEDFNALEAIYSVLLTFADPLVEMSMLSNVDDALKSYANSAGERFANFIGGILSGYVSQYFPTALGKFARAIDDTSRNTYPNDGAIDKTIRTIKNKIPFVSKTLEPKINLEGKEVKNVGGSFFGRLAYNMLSPGYYKANTVDEYDEELYRLYETTGNTDVFPSSYKTNVTHEKEKYELKNGDYTEWNKTRWSKEKELVDEFIDSESYQYYTDDEKVDTIKSIRKYAGEIAKDEFLEKQDIDYNETSYNNVVNAEKNDVDVYKYFLTKHYYGDLSGDNKKSDYIDYLKDSDMSNKAKNYMYSMQYGDSKGYEYVQELDTDDDTKFKIYEVMADTKADIDKDGNTISNSKARKIRQQYEKLGVYDKIVDYVNTHEDANWSSFGLTKTVVGENSSKGNSSKSDLKGSTTTKALKGNVAKTTKKSSNTTAQNGSSGVSSNNTSNNSLNLKKITGANTVLNSSSKGTISQNGKKLDDDYLNAYSKVFRKSLI